MLPVLYATLLVSCLLSETRASFCIRSVVLCTLIKTFREMQALAAPGFWFGGTSDKISYMNSTLKSCTAMVSPKFRFGGTFSKNVLIKNFFFEKF